MIQAMVEHNLRIQIAEIEQSNRDDLLRKLYDDGTLERSEYRSAISASADEVVKAKREIWDALKGKTNDRLVEWMLDNCAQDYPEHTLQVLETLPCSLQELNTMAENNGWCDVYKGFIRQARRDGVIEPEADDLGTDEMRAFTHYVEYNLTRDRRTNEKLRALIGDIVKAELTKAGVTQEEPEVRIYGDGKGKNAVNPEVTDEVEATEAELVEA